MEKTEKYKQKYTEAEIDMFPNESYFMDANVELLKDVIHLLLALIKTKYCNESEDAIEIDKIDSVIAGNLVRLYKLDISFLQNICERKTEIALIISRAIIECYINLSYIFAKQEEEYNTVRKQYINASLSTEKKAKDIINNNIKEFDGVSSPIEDRMLSSIQSSISISEDDSFEKLANWPNIKNRCQVHDDGKLLYDFLYGIQSHAVHGTWQDLLFNHIVEEGNNFKINLNWIEPRPQVLEGVILYNILTIIKFVDKELNSIKNDIDIISNEMIDYLRILSLKHENFINN